MSKAIDLRGRKAMRRFSVSASLVSRVARYIDTQEAHHRRMTFDAEFMALLKKHGVEFDPEFVCG
jgi:hypothetical protein